MIYELANFCQICKVECSDTIDNIVKKKDLRQYLNINFVHIGLNDTIENVKMKIQDN
jgi:hypothetical protein